MIPAAIRQMASTLNKSVNSPALTLKFATRNRVVQSKEIGLIQYKKVFSELKNAALNRKYRLPRDLNLNKELANNPTKEAMTTLLKEKGMINAEEFVNKLFLQTTLMFEFIKKHPEIAKLDTKTKMELLTKLLQD
ncbi:MAG: hypothetical protein EOO47_07155 [Flavobacterium sp.]|nr:MAG: hypothetical protein EOO47_07155 [Flavobacterium sp.]